MIAGAVTPTSAATMLLDGKPVTFAVPADALDTGIAMVFQENSLVPSMTVAQNLFLGEEQLFQPHARHSTSPRSSSSIAEF